MSTGQVRPATHARRTSRSSTSWATRRSSSARMGGFRNFAISLHDHLDPRGVPDLVHDRLRARWPGRRDVGLAARRPDVTIIALGMAEIASAYPTAGGLYYWASKLGSPGWGWATGWFNLIGQIAVTAAIGYGLAIFGQVLFDDWFTYTKHMNDWFGMLVQRGHLHRCTRSSCSPRSSSTCSTSELTLWPEHVLGVVAHGRRSAHRRDPHHRPRPSPVASRTCSRRRVNNSGLWRGHDLVLEPGVLVRVRARAPAWSQYTITGFDASAHTAEETHKASRVAAIGMWTSVFVSVVFGFILLVAVTFAIPGTTEEALDPDQQLRSGRPVDLDRVDGPPLGRVPALHLRGGAVLLRHRIVDVGVTNDVRVLA